MNKERAVTYSLLAHIRNNSTLIKGPLDIFIPLMKRVLSRMNFDNLFSGKTLLEIKIYSDKLYNIDFPIPVIKKILEEIAKEVNSEDKIVFQLYNDGSFAITGYVFTEFDDVIASHRANIENIEILFNDFCESSDIKEYKGESIFRFIEKNKTTLSRYLANTEYRNGLDYSIEAQFVQYFKNVKIVYEQIKAIYLGSILASYIEYKPENTQMNVELLLDTNFIFGLIDLNTSESKHTCQTLIKISKSQGYKIRVLKDTIDEIKALLAAKSDHFDKSFLQKKVYPEDIYNACERRGLNKTDLERISDKIEQEINLCGIDIIYDTKKYANEAKFSEDYRALLKVRNSERAALHDAIAITYVKKAREKPIYSFEKVNCWFVNNSINREGNSFFDASGKQPEVIKADDLLNILWLSNPQANSTVNSNELTELGLASLISLSLNDSLPKTSIIRELDDNIHKYLNEGINDEDVLRVATRITNKQLKDIQSLNELAENDNKEEFVRRINKEAEKQKQIEEARLKKLEETLINLNEKAENLENTRKKITQNNTIKNSRLTELEKKEKDLFRLKEDNRNEFIKHSLRKWRQKTWIEFSIGLIVILCVILYCWYNSNLERKSFSEYIKEFNSNVVIGGIITIFALVFKCFTLKSIYDKYRNHSNIENFKKGIKIPKSLE